MSETMVTVVGNVATAPVFRDTPGGQVARFRLASTTRYRDRATRAWTDGHTNFFTVWARWSLGANVAASLAVGEPVFVRGRLKVRGDDRATPPRISADIEAQLVGHDLSRGTAAFRRVARTEAMDPGAGAMQPVGGGAPVPAGSAGEGGVDQEPGDVAVVAPERQGGGWDAEGSAATDPWETPPDEVRGRLPDDGRRSTSPTQADLHLPVETDKPESTIQPSRELERAT